MKVGFYYSDPTKQVNKNYLYHGTNWQCWEPPNPDPAHQYICPENCYEVLSLWATNSTPTTVLLTGQHLAQCAGASFTWRGFEYWGEGDAGYNMVFEFGEWLTEEYSLLVTYPA